MPNPDRNDKEVRLFGEKSLREEAYHKKILQLEKEIANLEALAKQYEHTDYIKPHTRPKDLNNLYYESLLSFEKKIKKEQESLEKRATEITERLDIQAQRLIMDVESSFRRKTRWLFSIVAVSALLLILFTAYSNTEFLFERFYIQQPGKASLNSRVSYIRTALQTQTKYHHQYEVSNINVLGGVYMVEIELDSAPNDSWYIRDISHNVVKVFQKYSAYSPAEISFMHKGKLYLKASLAEASKRPSLQYFF